MSLGQEVRRLREAKGWKQVKLAVEADIAVSGISQIENGKRNPNSETLVKIARALEVDIADLFPKAEAPLWSGEVPEQHRDAFDFWEAREYLERLLDTDLPRAALGRLAVLLRVSAGRHYRPPAAAREHAS